MNELALFAGAGGGLLGSILNDWTTVCAVEIDPYCRQVLLQRQRDGALPFFPVWGDIRTFDGRPWRGCVDIVTAGFPCQPFSTASRGKKVATNLFGEVERIISEVRPWAIVFENVVENAFPEHVRPYLRRICPATMGSPSHRERYWLVAYSYDSEQPAEQIHAEVACVPETERAIWGQEALGGLLGMDDGLAHRMDRLKAIGNGQVPAVVRKAWGS